jgi:hypothetical protein
LFGQFSASMSGASAGLGCQSGLAASCVDRSRLDRASCRQGSNASGGDCRDRDRARSRYARLIRCRRRAGRPLRTSRIAIAAPTTRSSRVTLLAAFLTHASGASICGRTCLQAHSGAEVLGRTIAVHPTASGAIAAATILGATPGQTQSQGSQSTPPSPNVPSDADQLRDLHQHLPIRGPLSLPCRSSARQRWTRGPP